MLGYIYLITGPGPTYYVGQTNSSKGWESRYRGALSNVHPHQRRLFAAIQKHGVAAFTVSNLYHIPAEELDNVEQQVIMYFQKAGLALYNLTDGGGFHGGKLSPESKQLKAASLRRCWSTGDYRDKVTTAIRASWQDPNKRQNMLNGILAHAQRFEMTKDGKTLIGSALELARQVQVGNSTLHSIQTSILRVASGRRSKYKGWEVKLSNDKSKPLLITPWAAGVVREWNNTGFIGLLRHASGSYYYRKKIAGVRIRKSLKTKHLGTALNQYQQIFGKMPGQQNHKTVDKTQPHKQAWIATDVPHLYLLEPHKTYYRVTRKDGVRNRLSLKTRDIEEAKIKLIKLHINLTALEQIKTTKL